MPTKTKEYSLYAPGNLVVCRQALYSSEEKNMRIEAGSVGLILTGPNTSYTHHFQVQFVNNVTWWVHHNEIEPYLKDTTL